MGLFICKRFHHSENIFAEYSKKLKVAWLVEKTPFALLVKHDLLNHHPHEELYRVSLKLLVSEQSFHKNHILVEIHREFVVKLILQEQHVGFVFILYLFKVFLELLVTLVLRELPLHKVVLMVKLDEAYVFVGKVSRNVRR